MSGVLSTEYLEIFLRNLLLGENNPLHNREMHISGLLQSEKVDIKAKKVDIGNEKVDIGTRFSEKTLTHIKSLKKAFGYDKTFSRRDVMEIIQLQPSGASKFLSHLQKAEIILPVSGHGKGKYKFNAKYKS